ncbi:methanogen output domain 1-containing protein [Roseibium sp.]|uniref:methanogen output domain 1-containing protein n=1 Tax=Roseibium sp. TaxID=1936156 RepID=UPI003A9749BD
MANNEVSDSTDVAPEDADLPLERTPFFNEIIRELTGALQDVVGQRETEGFISLVGTRIGVAIDQQYRKALHVETLPKTVLSRVLVDLKKRIDGRFSVEYEDDEKIILTNSLCPFADNVRDRPSLCMMTANVFGRIVADNTGYARVDIQEAIARGDAGCRVVVHFHASETTDPDGKEFFRVTG